MRLIEVTRSGHEGRVRLSGVVEEAGGKRLPDVWLEYGEEYGDFVREEAEVFLPVLLVASMIRGERFETELGVSAKLARAVPTIQSIFGTWYADELKAVPAVLPKREARQCGTARYAGTFFSGGADAFYTTLKTKDEGGDGYGATTHLVHMTGIETPLSNTRTGKESRMAAIAGKLGLPVIMGRTNLRDCFDYKYLDFICGPALASVALSLSGGLSLVRVPSGGTYRQKDLYPQSSHPMLDFHWSTEYLSVVPHGCDVTRAEKIEYLAEFPLVLENLSVCIRNRGDFENCGRCPKCVGTMTVLQAIGALERCATLPSPYDYALPGRVNLDNPVVHGFWADYLDFIRRKGRDGRLLKVVERLFRRHERYRALVALARGTALYPVGRWIRRAAKRLTSSGR